MFKPSENNFGLPKSLIDSVAAVLAEKAPPFGKKDDKKKDAKADSADGDKKDDKKPAFGKKKSDDKGDSDKKPAFGKKDDDGDEDDKKPAFGKKKSDDDGEEMIGKDGKKTKVDLKPKLSIKEAAFTDSEINRIEAIMELSNKTLRSYAVKSDRHLMDIKPAWVRPTEYAKGAAVGAHGKTAQKRAQGGELAIKKIKSNIAKTNATTKEEVELDQAMKWEKKSHAALPSKDQPSLKAHKEAADWHRENYEDSSGDAKQYHKKRMLHHTTQADAMKSMTESKQFDKGDEPADHKYDSTKDKGPEHIIMQLRKAKSLGSANKHIEFNNGKKVKVDAAHVHKALDMHASFKRAPEKDEFTKQIAKSHDHLVRAVTNK